MVKTICVSATIQFTIRCKELKGGGADECCYYNYYNNAHYRSLLSVRSTDIKKYIRHCVPDNRSITT
jgi:hypothetical protein